MHGHCVGISDIQGEYLTSQKLPFFCPSCVSSSGIGHLPGFPPAPVFSFQWGELESADFSEHLNNHRRRKRGCWGCSSTPNLKLYCAIVIT